jgi:hypothetical protein
MGAVVQGNAAGNGNRRKREIPSLTAEEYGTVAPVMSVIGFGHLEGRM